MNHVLTIIFWFVLAFTAADYTLARATVKDPLRAVIAAVFALLFVIFVSNPSLLR
jgi:hypothetical protein